MGTFAEKVSYLNETKLLIKDAIENKGVTVEEDTPFREYANKIASISASVDDIEPIVLTGDCSYACAGAIASEYVKKFGDTISTSGVSSSAYMFFNYKNETIPFEINIDNNSNRDMGSMFYQAYSLRELPKINNAYPNSLQRFLSYCRKLRTIPEDWMDSWDFSYMYSSIYSSMSSCFEESYSLRSIPAKILSKLHTSGSPSSSYKLYNSGFRYCISLDEIVGVAVDQATLKSNVCAGFVTCAMRLKNLIFATNEDGSVQTANWKNQVIDLTSYVGYINRSGYLQSIVSDSTGITADKEVTDDASYQALKNDPDWFTANVAYSRYNHDSAVATINSLPDTSAYLAANGGTNTIKFSGAAGSKTDGGAINTLTEEEIAVATAKGWTVTLV